MQDLVLHIGLTKTGSTTVQSAFFRAFPGYLGRGGLNPNGNALTSDLLRHSHLNKMRRYRIASLRSWKAAVQQYMRDTQAKQHVSIVSSEVLAKSRGMGYADLFRFLQDLRAIWAPGNLKIVVVFRRQADKIASEYSQNSAKRFNASQQDFEKYLCQRVSEQALDYSNLVCGLWDTVGNENVCVLFMENMSQRDFWGELAAFCGIDDAALCDRAAGARPENKKARSSRTWVLLDPKNDLSAREFANTILTWVWPPRLLPRMRSAAKLPLQKAYRGICSLRALIERKRDRKIVLTLELERLAMDSFAESNGELARMLGRNLNKIGY